MLRFYRNVSFIINNFVDSFSLIVEHNNDSYRNCNILIIRYCNKYDELLLPIVNDLPINKCSKVKIKNVT